MTALSEYERLEASGLWRASPEAQAQNVIVSIGDATLVVTDMRDRALTHWSLAAVARANPGELPAIYHPDGDPEETLELPADEDAMISAIERLRTTIERRRPRPGRLRLVMLVSSLTVVLALGWFWLPGAVLRHAVTVVPPVKRAEIGDALLERITRVAGQPCTDPAGLRSLEKLRARVLDPDTRRRLVVLPSGLRETAHLPGRMILLNRALVEDPEEPDVAAGYILAEALRARVHDPLRALLEEAGTLATIRLLTTGDLGAGTLDAYAESLLTAPQEQVPEAALLAAFAEAQIRARPYAYARDVSGESTLGLIEADPFATTAPRPVLSDGDWLRLQGICGA